MRNSWFFVINPVSGNSKGLKVWEEIQKNLDESDVSYEYKISEYHKHTIEIVREKYASGFRNFIGIGGDGTINEIVNALFSDVALPESHTTVSLVPVGTGNDWVRNHQEILNPSNIVQKIRENNTLTHDVGAIDSEEHKIKHFFINVAGFGLDGSVVKELEKLNASGNKGKLSYVKSMLKALIQFSSFEAQIATVEEKNFEGQTLLLAAAKGQFFGSGMHISPLSKPNNGELDITWVKNDSNWVILPQLYKLFTGEIAKVTFVEKSTCSEIRIVSDRLIPIQADGEYVGEANQIKFSIIKQAVLVLT